MDGGGCCYRGDEGCRCAIGALIDDEYYFDYLEGRTADDDTVLLALTRSGWPTQGKIHKDFYLRLQTAHDYPVSVPDCDFLLAFEKNMAIVAKYYGLDYHA